MDNNNNCLVYHQVLNWYGKLTFYNSNNNNMDSKQK